MVWCLQEGRVQVHDGLRAHLDHDRQHCHVLVSSALMHVYRPVLYPATFSWVTSPQVKSRSSDGGAYPPPPMLEALSLTSNNP